MNAMNEFVKPTLVLAIICLVITALLSVSHEITQPIIQENERKTAELARAEVLAEADSFDVQGYNDPQGLLKRFVPSPSIIEESWGDRDLIQEIIEGKKYYMPEAEQQVKLD